MKKASFILDLTLGTIASNIQAQSWFHADSIKSHIQYLASDELKGRGTGTDGEKLAADYTIKRFSEWGLQPAGENKTWKQEFDFATGTHGQGGRTGKANNVVAYLNNQAAYTIVIGAHYDHLGEGNDGHSLDPHSAGQIHNGADDNASGTAGVLELARYFATNDEKEPFNFLFICFSGEELGLLGSAHFANNPTIDLSKVNCMLNMDMIGRLKKDKPVLEVSGIGTAPEWDKLVSKFSSTAMVIQTDSSGVDRKSVV
jgi:acetylornithine deacetylase/succinyl-diaminopimelate desuccinylase-like protein